MNIVDLIEWYGNRIKAVGPADAYKELFSMGFNMTLTSVVGKLVFDDNGELKILPQCPR